MHLHADKIYAEPREDDSPNSVGFHDRSADYCLILSRFSDLDPDQSSVNVMVRDQIHAETANLQLVLGRNSCRLQLDEATSSHLLGVREYIVEFHADEKTYRLMVELLRIIFQGLPGLTVEDER